MRFAVSAKRWERGVIDAIRRGDMGILPTDTIYGLVGSALNRKAVEKIYRLRQRNLRKPMIVLISSLADLKKFGVKIGVQERKILRRVWPSKVSVILPCPPKKLFYLHRGMKTIAFRLPKPLWLRCLLRKTGPLVAPSANLEGEPPARTIAEARQYFGDKVEFYINTGRLVSKPSTLAALKNGHLRVLRKGAVKIAI